MQLINENKNSQINSDFIGILKFGINLFING